jgi:hypothetical protein
MREMDPELVTACKGVCGFWDIATPMAEGEHRERFEI